MKKQKVDSQHVVPLSEQISDLFAPKREVDRDGELLDFEGILSSTNIHDANDDDQDGGLDIFKGAKRTLAIVSDVEDRYGGKVASRKDLNDDEDDSDDSDEGENEDESDHLKSEEEEEEDGDDESGENDSEEGGEAFYDDGNNVQEGLMNVVSKAAKSEMEKAKSVEVQTKIWQRILAVRIKMQAVLLSTSALPLSEDAELYCHGEGASELAKDLGDTFLELAEMRKLLLKNHPEFADCDVPKLSMKLGDEDVWRWLSESNKATRDKEESLVDEWNKRTDAQVGKHFKALGRPIMEQIRYGLKNDREKLIRRTQLNRSANTPFGQKRARDEPAYFGDIYDDSDFYNQLLKTFLEGTLNVSTNQDAMKSTKRKKKYLDKKTKRQTVNTNVQEKLLNYMAPQGSLMLPPMADSLFASLFGKQ